MKNIYEYVYYKFNLMIQQGNKVDLDEIKIKVILVNIIGISDYFCEVQPQYKKACRCI